jgi:hypothetical protein
MTQLFDLIGELPTPFNMVAIICLISAVATVIGSFFKQLRKYVCHRQELEFKREMVDRGMSAEEIESVIRVHGDRSISK